jgi:ABC-type polysaccharide/polyol phosphate transport system ATPase subunit
MLRVPAREHRNVAVEVRGLKKAFRIPTKRVDTLKERVASAFRPREFGRLEALAGIDFEIFEGEFFGVVGRNGSGKSTLLKLLASIYRADAGRIRVAGRIAPCIELGVGFNTELNAFDNVVLNGVMMGLSPEEARARFDDVIEFAGLEEYTELKLKNYSSGMLVRLGFSLMTQVDADVLLVDEVLAVGDAAFQQKCIDAFAEHHAKGKTIILVTHDMNVVQARCDRALLLERGRLELSGDPADVSRRYMELNFPDAGQGVRGEAVGVDAGARRARIADVRLRDASGAPATSFEQGDPIGVEMTVEAAAHLEHPVFGFEFVNSDGQIVFAPKPQPLKDGRPLEPGDRVRVTARLDNQLATGHYFVNCGVALEFEDLHPVAFQRSAADFVVFGTRGFGGMVALGFDAQAEAIE